MADDKTQKEIDEIIPLAGDKQAAVAVDNEIFVMPSEFYEAGPTGSSKSLIIILLVGVVVIVFALATAYVLWGKNIFPTSETGEVTAEPAGLVSNESTTPVEPIPAPNDDQATTSQDINVDNQAESVMVDNGEIKVWDQFPDKLPVSIDLDRDGLTDIEETVLGTDAALADSDGDGFTDGSELKSGYDPARPKADLLSSPAWQDYTNVTPQFNFRLPRVWGESRVMPSANRVEFTGANGDKIVIEVFDNKDKLSLNTWFSEFAPNKDVSLLEMRSVGNRATLAEPSGLALYISLDGFIARLEYDVQGKLEVAYPAIWQFIISSFK